MVRRPFLLEGHRPVLEELFLPAVEDRGLQAEFIAELRDGLLPKQMSPQAGDLLFRRVMLPPDGSFGVLYLGADLECSFIETFSQNTGDRIVTTKAPEDRTVSVVRAVRPLRLVDLFHSGGMSRLGADARLISGDHQIAQ